MEAQTQGKDCGSDLAHGGAVPTQYAGAPPAKLKQTRPRRELDASEDAPIVLKLREREVTFTGKTYLLAWVLPNFYFHAATAYDILRHNGLEIGKKDFLGE